MQHFHKDLKVKCICPLQYILLSYGNRKEMATVIVMINKQHQQYKYIAVLSFLFIQFLSAGKNVVI